MCLGGALEGWDGVGVETCTSLLASDTVLSVSECECNGTFDDRMKTVLSLPSTSLGGKGG